MPNRPNEGKTNSKYKSKKLNDSNEIIFADLKANYPTGAPCAQNVFKNQCAIKLAVSLQLAGVSLKTFHGACCGQHSHIKHVLRAEEFADWLKKRYLASWPNPSDITGEDWQDKAIGKTGVIFFKDYWLRKGEKSPTGDHIDLWDKDKLVSGGVVGFTRFTLGINSLDLSLIDSSLGTNLSFSDLGKSKQILLWVIK
jgi:hypothetical protein